jgi:hypothetical protein
LLCAILSWKSEMLLKHWRTSQHVIRTQEIKTYKPQKTTAESLKTSNTYFVLC